METTVTIGDYESRTWGRYALEEAISQIGRGERDSPWPRNNRGPDIQRYRTDLQGDVHGIAGRSWCAAFVSWCIEQGWRTRAIAHSQYNASNCPFRRTHWARGLKRRVLDVGGTEVHTIEAVLPGDIVIVRRGLGGHVFFVRENNSSRAYAKYLIVPGALYSVEGNAGHAPAKVKSIDHTYDAETHALRSGHYTNPWRRIHAIVRLP